ncbi:MAG: RsbRD N-terminal domain-containing protein [Deltaproteobacteria bacterium]|nr:RsbRD N-terminal domain-containing protein [Deltaproteobacteria bacterium]
MNNLLAKQKTAVVKKWFALAINTYPPDTAKFLQKQKDPIANPVGRTIFQGLETLFDELLKDLDHEAIRLALDPVIRIRAIQNYSPAQAVGFLFFLKRVIRDSVHEDLHKEDLLDELLAFESKVDELSLIAFNIYMQCKEKIYELRANEIKNRTFKAFERAGLVKAMPEVEPDPKPFINII